MTMKIKKFDVVELKDNNRATILETEKNQYFAEIVNSYGITLENRYITQDDIEKVIYSRNNKNMIRTEL